MLDASANSKEPIKLEPVILYGPYAMSALPVDPTVDR